MTAGVVPTVCEAGFGFTEEQLDGEYVPAVIIFGEEHGAAVG